MVGLDAAYVTWLQSTIDQLRSILQVVCPHVIGLQTCKTFMNIACIHEPQSMLDSQLNIQTQVQSE